MTYDGKRWGAGDGLQPRTAVGLLWPADAEPPATDVQPGQLDVHVLDLEQRNLPIPVEPRQLARNNFV